MEGMNGFWVLGNQKLGERVGAVEQHVSQHTADVTALHASTQSLAAACANIQVKVWKGEGGRGVSLCCSCCRSKKTADFISLGCRIALAFCKTPL